MKSVRVEMKKNAINKRLDPKQELQKAEMAVAIAQRKNEEEGQHEAEMALAIARRKNGLCIYCGQMNQEAGDGYLGGTCAECLGVSVREMKQMLR